MLSIPLQDSRPLDVILLGRITIDLNPVWTDQLKEDFKPLQEVTYFERFVGGSPANIAVGLAKHGLTVGFIGKVSNDQFGDYVTSYFKNAGIDTSHITRAEHGEKLGLTFTEMLSPDESHILMYRNRIADLQLSVADIDETYISTARLLVISGTALSESPSREAALKAALIAKRIGVPILFDIDYRPYGWKNNDEVAIYCSALAHLADVVIGSREEFDLTEALSAPQLDDAGSASYWEADKNKIIIIKHGKSGSTAYAPGEEPYTVKPVVVRARKNFGGGDGYAAGFIYGLFQGWPLGDSLEFASAEASMMVCANNCSDDLPSPGEVHRFIAEHSTERD